MSRIGVNGIEMYYESRGEGEPLFLVHGGGDSHETWEYQIQDLSLHFRVITCDLRGMAIQTKGTLASIR